MQNVNLNVRHHKLAAALSSYGIARALLLAETLDDLTDGGTIPVPLADLVDAVEDDSRWDSASRDAALDVLCRLGRLDAELIPGEDVLLTFHPQARSSAKAA